jgi:hypothetical protein
VQLLFVYNAESGSGNALLDGMHKVLRPQTYPCALCSLTHGVFTQKKQWRDFVRSLDIAPIFLHKDQFVRAYRSKWLPKYDYPVVLAIEGGELKPFATRQTIEGIKDVEGLIALVQDRLTPG